MVKQMISIALGVCLLGSAPASNVHANELDRKTIFTFAHSIEVPGQVLPPGTYTFMLANSASDRHFVNVFAADGKRMVAAFPTVPEHRLTPTDETVIAFHAVPNGSPDAIRAWFYPGDTVGLEFVYSRRRVAEFAEVTPGVEGEATGSAIVAVTAE